VFTLLETLYRAFDEIATRRRVFKVETIGDCYVAVTGVPEPQKDHAVIMCRFAKDMLFKCNMLTSRLECTLGPDTGDLDLRVGIHSGPVTAGVLRGERSRFQLFGDTMNTASRTESTGTRGKIQLSQDTADLIMAAGKNHWLTQREDKVHAKGKGEMTTYWLAINRSDAGSSNGSFEFSDESRRRIVAIEAQRALSAPKLASEKLARLVEWNCEVLIRLLKQISARRTAASFSSKAQLASEAAYMQSGNLAIEDVKEIIRLC
jgi:class 3 adenylate cyclase